LHVCIKTEGHAVYFALHFMLASFLLFSFQLQSDSLFGKYGTEAASTT